MKPPSVKQKIKRWLFALLGKDPEAVVVTFASGPPELCRRMAEEVRALEPRRRHFLATPENWPRLKRELRRYRIGLAPVLLTPEPSPLRRAAYRLAPRKILAYNSRLERHHLRSTWLRFLFWRGVPLDRIWLRPCWWPWPRRERTVAPESRQTFDGRPCSPDRRRIAVLSPYFPYPLAHGGAVRIYHLLRELAREFDVELFAFTDAAGQGIAPADVAPVLEFCARIVLVEKPRYREPRWSTLLPPEVHEFRSPAMRRALADERRAFGFELLQVEYTQLAPYAGDVLVEHDVTFDLFAQILRPRAHARRVVGLVPLAPLRNPRPAPLPPRGSHVQEGCRYARPAGARRGGRKRRGPRIAFSRRPSAPASACSSSAPFAISPISKPTASSPTRSGRCCGSSFPGSS